MKLISKAGKPGNDLTVDLIRQAMEYAEACGTAIEDSVKLAGVFHGERAPLTLRKPVIYITSINRFCAGLPEDPSGPQPDADSIVDEDLTLLGRLGGKLILPATQYRNALEFELREEGPQNLFAVLIHRLGNVSQQGGQNVFPSLSIVCTETVGEHALVMSIDLLNDGETIGADWSNALYRPRRNVGGVQTRENRLATLTGLTNLPHIALGAAEKAGFPVYAVRKNRNSPGENQALRTGIAAPPAYAGIGAGSSGYQPLSHETDPFYGE